MTKFDIVEYIRGLKKPSKQQMLILELSKMQISDKKELKKYGILKRAETANYKATMLNMKARAAVSEIGNKDKKRIAGEDLRRKILAGAFFLKYIKIEDALKTELDGVAFSEFLTRDTDKELFKNGS